jgi:type IV pilus assembly protein PilB
MQGARAHRTIRGLGDILVREKFITQEQLNKALNGSKGSGDKLIDSLVNQGITDEQTLMEFFSKNYRIPIMDLSSWEADPAIIKLVPESLIIKHQLLPVARRGDTLVVASSDPTNMQAVDDVRFQARLRVEQVLALPSVLKVLIQTQFGVKIDRLADEVEIESSREDVVESYGQGDEGPIIQFVQNVLADAIRRRASDIHIEPYEKDLRVRLRIDGDLVESMKPPPKIRGAITARIKVMSKMRLDENRLPQDGRIRLKVGTKVVDFRVNTLPTVFGEKVVLRILDRSNANKRLEQLGFEKDDMDKFKWGVTQPWGMVLVTGPTGSGKTTTLYAALNEINTPDVNISTIEDPVEYNFPGINQVQTKEQIGLDFAETLRALLRQDPDIILLGEIRDKITAEVAFKAALTGHLVLSTLHTNDAPSTIMRLKDMGVDCFLINSAVHLVVAQRLVRTVCQQCKAPDPKATPEMMQKIGFPLKVIGKFQAYRGTGCADCRNTGYKGRAAIHEILRMTDHLKELVGKNCSTEELRREAMKEGMKPLKINLMRKVMAGVCSIDEMSAVGS